MIQFKLFENQWLKLNITCALDMLYLEIVLKWRTNDFIKPTVVFFYYML